MKHRKNEEQWEAQSEEKEHELLERWPWILPVATGIFLGAAAFEMGAGLAIGAGGFLYLAYVSFKESQWGWWRRLVLVTAGAAVMGIISLF